MSTLGKTNVAGKKARLGFTLAEVLITLGIIGVVAAMTLPSLIANYQKKVYYNQFMKAVNVVENALKRYEYDNGCEGNIWNCVTAVGYHGFPVNNLQFEPNFVDNFSKYFNVAQIINEDNADSVCAKGYKKLPVSYHLDSSNREKDDEYTIICINNTGIPSSNYGFITTDGMFFNFGQDEAEGNGAIVDINGPNKGPNTFGRDIFIFYIDNSYSKEITWGGQETYPEPCDNTNAYGCAAKLLQEGKMNY